MRDTSDLTLSTQELETLINIFPQGVCAFDFEMTGLSPIFDKIIEIAAVKVTPDGLVEQFHALVNPLIEIPEHTIAYHGLQNKDLRQAPSLKKPLKNFCEFYGNLPLIAHSAMFDASFLVKNLHEYHYDIGLSDIYDSCRLARSYFKKKEPAPENFKLSTLAKYYKMDFSHHQALDDAKACLKIFASVCQEIPDKERKSLMRNYGYLFKLKDFKKQENYILPKKLEELRSYLVLKTPVQIKYQGGKRKDEFRPIRPVALLPLPQGLMLYAECLHDNMNKYFQTKKIKAIKEIE